MAAATKPLKILPIRHPKIADFFVLFLWYRREAGTIRELPITKLASSPIPPVEVDVNCKKFLMNSIVMPLIGPYAKPPKKAGISEKSNFANEGERGN